MEVAFVDLILIIIIGGFVFYGAFFGFIHTLGSLIGAIIASVIASRIIDSVFEWVGYIFGGGVWARIILFIIIFLVLTKLIGLLFTMVEKVWSIVPLGKSLNRLLGIVFGFIEGVIVVGVIIYFAMLYLPEEGVRSALEMSAVADYLLMVAGTTAILLPDALQQANEAAQNIELPNIDINIEMPSEAAEIAEQMAE
ncbi:MAG: CvpA family protein [Candidatus Uhrbacteria bacterium]